jgi:hypothetical protein
VCTVYEAAATSYGDSCFPDCTHHGCKVMVNRLNKRYLREIWDSLGSKLTRKELYENAIHESSRWIEKIYDESKSELPLPDYSFS